MEGIGTAILLIISVPWLCAGGLVFLLFSVFSWTRIAAIPTAIFAIGAAAGNFFFHEHWAESVGRFTWYKPWIEAPLHSISFGVACVILSAIALCRSNSLRTAQTFLTVVLGIMVAPLIIGFVCYSCMRIFPNHLLMMFLAGTAIGSACMFLVARDSYRKLDQYSLFSPKRLQGTQQS